MGRKTFHGSSRKILSLSVSPLGPFVLYANIYLASAPHIHRITHTGDEEAYAGMVRLRQHMQSI
jgi:hypothetical protein